MAGIESSTSRDNSDAEKQLQEQRRLAEQKEKSRPPETPQDARTKEVLVSSLPRVKEALGKQNTEIEKLIAELKAKEYNVSDSFSGMMKSFGNFTSPENLMGLSTLVRGDGKTNTGERLETIESFQSRSKIQYTALLRLEYALSSGQRLEDIQKDRSMVPFFMGAEGKYILALASGMPHEQAMQEYNLNKARELKNFIINGNLLAESYYDKLKGTPYEQQADNERMGKLEYFHKKWLTDFGNTFLSLDQLGLLVTGGIIGKGVGATVAMSPKLAQVSVQATEKLSTGVPGVITKAIPGVNAIKTQAGEGVAMTLGKFGINFSVEVGKFAGYETLAQRFGGDDTAKIVAMVMMVIPGAKEGFASSLRAKVANEGKQIQNGELKGEFVKWIQENYGVDKAKQMLYAGLVEAKAQNWKQTGRIVGAGYDTEIAKSVDAMMANLLASTQPVKQTIEGVAQAITHNPPSQPKKTDTPKATLPEVTKEQPQESLPETTDTTKQVRNKVADVVGDSPEMTELLKAGLPRGYILALKEHGIDESTLLKMKGWSGKKPEEVQLINDAIRTHNQDALQNNRPDLMLTPEEGHAIYGYSTNLFFKTLNGALWKNEGEKLSLTSILQSGLEKLPLAKPTQYRGDNHLLNEVLQGRPVSKEFLESPEGVKFLTELEGKRFTLKGFTSSADNPADTFLEEGGIKYYLTIHGSSAKDITPLAVFPNFGDKLKVPKLQPDGTTKLEFGQKTSQESTFPPGTEIVINKAKKDEINGNTFISIEASEVPKK